MPESLLDAVAAEKEEAINNQTIEAYEGQHRTIYDDNDEDIGGKYGIMTVVLCISVKEKDLLIVMEMIH